MKRFNWREQNIALTGATGGLGQALAEQLTERGASVLLIARSQPRLDVLSTRLNQPALSADLNDASGRQLLYDVVATSSEPLTGLINNAACTHEGLFGCAGAEDIERVIDTNLKTPLLLLNELLPSLIETQGWVMNIGSVFGAIGFPGQSLYCSSKFGLRGFSEAIQRELKDDDVTVLYCAPRAIKTALNQGLIRRLNQRLQTRQDSPEWVASRIIQQIEQQHRQQTLGWPEKVFARLNGLWPEQVSRSLTTARNALYTLIEEKNYE